jgi:biofilm PGA synthesis N-glycosyltransferase PgaC
MVTILSLLSMILPMPGFLYVAPMSPGWNGVVLGVTCMLQIALSMFLDSKYDVGLWKIYFWMIWYPLVYWMLNVITVVFAVPQTLLRRNKQYATWVSPDRGLKKP